MFQKFDILDHRELNPRGHTILLVDDDDISRENTARILEKAGYMVIPEKSGEGALSVWGCLRQTFGLVITELVMPGMSGHSLIAEMIKRHEDTRFLVASSLVNKRTNWKDAPPGAVEFIAKPFDSVTLEKRVSRLLLPARLSI